MVTQEIKATWGPMVYEAILVQAARRVRLVLWVPPARQVLWAQLDRWVWLDKVAQLGELGKPVLPATRETLAPLDLPAHLVLLVREVLPETLATLEIRV